MDKSPRGVLILQLGKVGKVGKVGKEVLDTIQRVDNEEPKDLQKMPNN